MLHTDQVEQRVSTGVDALDAVLGGLYWGDNVVWQLEGAPAEPFYRAIASLDRAFDASSWIAVTSDPIPAGAAFSRLEVIDASPGSALAQPAELLRDLRRRCDTRRRNLLLFESLDGMVRSWGAEMASGFFARCCPLLLEIGAIAYWSMNLREIPPVVRETAEVTTQCVLRVDEHTVRVSKAEGRDEDARGSLLHWHVEDQRALLTPTGLQGRVAASLRGVRRSRVMSQHDLGVMAGVSSSAISQAERAERGLSLATLVRLSAALGITIDALLRGEDTSLYQIGRRTEDPRRGPERTMTLISGVSSGVRVELVHLGPREAGRPVDRQNGQGIVAVASGLVQVRVGGQTPALRHGEVLLADCRRIDGWRNLGEAEGVLFWIVVPPPSA